jgi:hypothetical protein
MTPRADRLAMPPPNLRVTAGMFTDTYFDVAFVD